MKKSLKIIILVIVLLAVISCIYFVINFNESDNKTTTEEKKILKLMHDDTENLSDDEKNIDYTTVKINNLEPIELNSDLTEKETTYNNDYYDELKIFIDYIKNNLSIKIDGSWHFYIHLYDGDDTGYINFTYYINDEISTTKSILFIFSQNNIEEVSYSYLNEKVDEKDVIEKVNNFKNNTIQEKKTLSDDEKLIKEDIVYNYDYKLKKILYYYEVSFENSLEVIDNDYYSLYYVD
jgi:CRISPR/Cas system-associated exonuclease Cas4 (RecB family)